MKTTTTIKSLMQTNIYKKHANQCKPKSFFLLLGFCFFAINIFGQCDVSTQIGSDLDCVINATTQSYTCADAGAKFCLMGGNDCGDSAWKCHNLTVEVCETLEPIPCSEYSYGSYLYQGCGGSSTSNLLLIEPDGGGDYNCSIVADGYLDFGQAAVGDSYTLIVCSTSKNLSTGEGGFTFNCPTCEMMVDCPTTNYRPYTCDDPIPALTLDNLNDFGITINNPCGDVTLEYSDDPTYCMTGTHTRTVTFTDGNGNETSCEINYDIEYILEINCSAEDKVVSGCLSQSEIDQMFDQWKSDFGYDNECGDATTNLDEYSAPSRCPAEDITVVVSYVVTDDCGPSEPCVKRFTVEATSGPTIDCPDVTTFVVSCFSEISPPTLTWSGSCGQGGEITKEAGDGTSCNGNSYTYTYEIEDNCGRSAEACVLTYNIVNGGPTIDCPDVTTFEVSCFSEISPPTLTWSGSCGQGGEITKEAGDGTSCNGNSYTYTYEIEDNCGRSAVPCELVYTIINDGIKIICPEQTEFEVVCFDNIEPPTLSYVDQCGDDGTITPPNPSINGSPDCEGTTYTYIYQASNDCSSDECVIIYTITNEGPTLGYPSNVALDACSSPEVVVGAFNSWIDGFTVDGGCDTESNLDDLPQWSDDYQCGQAIDISFELCTDDNCQPDDSGTSGASTEGDVTNCVSSSFRVTGSDAPIAYCPSDFDPSIAVTTGEYDLAPNSISGCASQDDIQEAFEAWKDGFSYSGGCGIVSTNLDDYPDAPQGCNLDDSVLSIDYVVTDACNKSSSCLASFTVLAVSAPEVYCPSEVDPSTYATTGESVPNSISGCSSLEDILASFNSWLEGFESYNGCGQLDESFDYDETLLESCKLNDQTIEVTFSVEDDCNRNASCAATFTIFAVPSVDIDCPVPVEVGSCSQDEINTRYAEWLEGFGVRSVGCGLEVLTNLDEYLEPPSNCGVEDETVTIVFEAGDVCRTTSCTSSFTVLAVDEPELSCPGEDIPNEISGCASQEDINAAFDLWLESFSVISYGCGENMPNNLDDLQAPQGCVNEDQTVDVEFSLIDDCNRESNCNASFTVTSTGSPLDISCGESSSLEACSEYEDIEEAYNIWKDGFSVSGGCNTSSNLISGFPALPVFVCGEGLTLEFALVATDDCTGGLSCQTSFFVVDPEPLVLMAPDPILLSACSSQEDLESAYSDWVDGFSASGGCDISDNKLTIPELGEYRCGLPFAFEFVYIALDNCTGEDSSLNSSFGVEEALPLEVNCVDDMAIPLCASLEEIQDAFIFWVDGFGHSFGCNPVIDNISLARPAMPDFHCLDELSIDFEYTVYDDCHPEGLSCISTFSIVGKIEYYFDDFIPSPEEYQCFSEVPALESQRLMSNCGDMMDIEPTEEIIQTDLGCTNNATILRTWYYQDECGREINATQEIIVKDDIPPVAPGPPADLNISCEDEIPVGDILIASDNCDGEIVGIMTESRLELDCPHSYIMRRVWTFTDDCGNQSSVSQDIHVSDNEGPSIPRYVSVILSSCEPDMGIPEPLIAFDNCSGEIEGTMEQSYFEGDCLYDYRLTRIWSFVDECGNESIFTQELSFSDTEPPIAQQEPEDLILSCREDIPAASPMTAIDGCFGEISVVPVDHMISDICENNYIMDRIWTFEDGCSNILEVTQRISVLDEEAPYLSNIPADLVIKCKDDIPNPPLVMLMDNCIPYARIEADLKESTEYDIADCLSNYTITRTWSATDDCDYVFSATQKIRVEDKTAPELVGNLPTDIVVDCDIPDFNLQFRDECGNDNISVVTNEERIDDIYCAYNHVLLRTYSATDCAGNNISGSYRITVVDNTSPTLEFNHPLLNGLEDYGVVEVSCERNSNGTFALPVFNPSSVIVTDNCSSSSMDVRLTDNQIASGTCYVDEYIALFECVFEAADECGNVGQRGFYLKIVDNQKPEFLEYPTSEIYATCDNVPEAKLIEATDQCSSLEIYVDDERFSGSSNCMGDDYIMRTWTAVDECGNTNTTSQKIILEASPPKILDYGPSYLDFSQPICREYLDDLYIIGGSDCGLEVSYEYEEETLEVFCEDVELIRRNYYLEDECGNTAIEYFDIYVYRDEQYNPSFAITNPMLAEFMNTGNFGLNSEITIQCSEIQENEINQNSLALASGCEDFYYMSFNAVDNFALNCDAGYASFTDYTWYLSSACNTNISEFSFRVNYIDDVPPQIELSGDQVTVFCDEGMPEVNVSDDCSEVEVQISDLHRDSDCILRDIIERTITATDQCGNVSERIQIVKLNPRPPVFALEESVCGSIDEQVQATARFECADLTLNAELISTDFVTQCDSGTSEYTRLFRVISPCGEAYDYRQTVYTDDLTPPVFVETAHEEFINSGVVTISESDQSLYFILQDILDGNAVTAIDDCGQSLEVDASMGYFDLDCGTDGAEGQYNFEWRASDQCGNQISKELVVRVIDYVPPIATNPPSNITIYCGNEIPEVNLNVQESGYYFEDYSEYFEDGNLIRTWDLYDYCGNSSTYFQIVSYAHGSIQAILGAPEEISCNSNITLTSSIQGGEGPYTYNWSVESGDYSILGSSTSSTASVVVGFASADIRLDVRDSHGCFTSEVISLSCDFDHDIDNGQNISRFDLDANSLQAAERSRLNIESSEENIFEARIYPNPTSGVVEVVSKTVIDKIEVISMEGELLESFSNISDKAHRLDLRNTKAGVYYVKIYSRMKVTIGKLFIVF